LAKTAVCLLVQGLPLCFTEVQKLEPGGHVALFVLVIVGLIVAQTWLDWRDTRKTWIVPDWARGAALAGLIAVSLAAATSFASIWIQESADQFDTGVTSSRLFWPQIGFLVCMMGIIVVGIRKKRMRLMMALAGCLVAAFWVGMTFSS
jgi:hypothetical protein